MQKLPKEHRSESPVKTLYKMLMDMCSRTGYTPDAVFEGLLDYMVGMLNPSLTPQPVEGWKFKEADTKTFVEMVKEVIGIYSREIGHYGWYDPFGDLYMAIHQGGNGKGQFFTPPSVVNITAQLTCDNWDEPEGHITPFGKRITISDCAAGSGRMPLAWYFIILKKMQKEWGYTPAQAEAKRPYVCCEDLDLNCVKMSAINMAFHGCFGEAVCHDSLCEPDKVNVGYIINETMYPFPTEIPSIRKETNPMRFVSTSFWAKRANAGHESTIDETPKEHEVAKEAKPVISGDVIKKQPTQLTLW